MLPANFTQLSPQSLAFNGVNPFEVDLASSGIQFKIAHSISELEQSFRLVHDSYVKAGLSEPKESGLRLTLQHAVPGSAVIIAMHHNTVVFTVSVLSDSWLGLPMDQLYKTENDNLRCEKRKLAEFGSLAFHKSFAEIAPELTPLMPAILAHGLNLAAHYAIDLLDADDLVCACSPIHAAFYRRQVLFETFGPERSYDYVCGNPAVALRLPLKSLGDRLRMAGQGSRRLKVAADYFHSNLSCVEWPESLPLWTQDMLTHFFARRTSLFYQTALADVTRLLREHRWQRERRENVRSDHHDMTEFTARTSA